MPGSRNFCQGVGSRSIWQNKLWQFFFLLILILFYRSQMVNFKENYPFSRFQRGFVIYQGGSNFFQEVGGGGSNCLFPIETHITCDFPGGGGGLRPLPPLWIRTCYLYVAWLIKDLPPPPPPPNPEKILCCLLQYVVIGTQWVNSPATNIVLVPLFAHLYTIFTHHTNIEHTVTLEQP